MVGAGVVGLSCAVRLAEAGFEVDVLARELPLETTSAVAGGLWMPYLAEPAEAVARWARGTLEELVRLSDAGAPGVVLRDGHILGEAGAPAWAGGVEATLRLAQTSHPTPQHTQGWQLRVPVVDMTMYLPYLVERLAAAGGTLTRLALSGLPTRGLVLNCSGVAARALAADPSVYPVRGQVLRLSNPGVDTWWSDEGDPAGPTYVIPHAKHVVVGGSAELNDWSTTPEPELGEQILKRATRLVPQLASARVLGRRSTATGTAAAASRSPGAARTTSWRWPAKPPRAERDVPAGVPSPRGAQSDRYVFRRVVAGHLRGALASRVVAQPVSRFRHHVGGTPDGPALGGNGGRSRRCDRRRRSRRARASVPPGTDIGRGGRRRRGRPGGDADLRGRRGGGCEGCRAVPARRRDERREDVVHRGHLDVVRTAAQPRPRPAHQPGQLRPDGGPGQRDRPDRPDPLAAGPARPDLGPRPRRSGGVVS